MRTSLTTPWWLRHEVECGEDSRRLAQLPEGVGGQRFRGRAESGDVHGSRCCKTDSVSVEVDGTRYDAQVVSYDPNRDISILDVPNLRAQPLLLAEVVADSGTDALMLGYPGGGDFVATPVRIREVVELNGPDIYRTTTVTREMNTIRGAVRQGDSGGPIIDLDGKALGVAFGAAVDDPDTGFVLTVREVAPQLAKVGNTVPVARAPWEAMVGTACPLGSRVLPSS